MEFKDPKENLCVFLKIIGYQTGRLNFFAFSRPLSLLLTRKVAAASFVSQQRARLG